MAISASLSPPSLLWIAIEASLDAKITKLLPPFLIDFYGNASIEKDSSNEHQNRGSHKFSFRGLCAFVMTIAVYVHLFKAAFSHHTPALSSKDWL